MNEPKAMNQARYDRIEQARTPAGSIACKVYNDLIDKKKLTLSEYVKKAHENATIKGFHLKDKGIMQALYKTTSLAEYKACLDHHTNLTISKDLALVITELAEAIEFARKGMFCKNKDNWKETFEEEIADAFIRLFDFCGSYGIDIEHFINAKMEYNESREYLHGKEF